MAEIVEVTMAEILRDLPEPVPWQKSNTAESGIDVLIGCAGFEDRAGAILSNLRGTSVEHAITVVYPTNSNDNESGLKRFQECTAFKRQSVVHYDRSTFLQSITAALRGVVGSVEPRIVVDLSAMASYVIYRVLSSCLEVFPMAEIGVHYTEAEQYSPSHDEWLDFFHSVSDPDDNLAVAERYEEKHFQAVGVDETYESDVAPGRNPDPLATRLIAIPSFSLQRMKSMLAFAQTQYGVGTDDVSWFLGQPPDRKRNGWRYDALAALYNVKNEGVPVSTLNYREILQELDGRWEDASADNHIVIAAMGSKMQHLGVFLFLCMHPECGLLLCEPKSFIANAYSKGCGTSWWLEFGRANRLMTLLKSRGTLKFTW